jgi:ABC-type glycerol-3-phosphate transport system permease component
MVHRIANQFSRTRGCYTAYFLSKGDFPVLKFLLWCILLILCWPLAVLALVLYPVIWLVLLPFRLVGVVVSGVLDLIWSLFGLPARLVRKLA